MNRLTGSAMLMRSTTRVLSMLPILALVLTAPVGAGEVNGTIFLDPSRLAGGDDLGRVLLFTPDPLQQGSSVSHWDVSASPDLLMEPFASPSLTLGEVDLTLPQMLDIGWTSGTSTRFCPTATHFLWLIWSFTSTSITTTPSDRRISP